MHDPTDSVTDAATGGDRVTHLLRSWRRGDDEARDRVVALVYEELHRLADRRMRGERQGHTLQPTALVNEAFLRLAGADVPWQDRTHFYAVAARTMRRVLVDHARAKRRQKRGGGLREVTLEDAAIVGPERPVDMIALDGALDRLGEQDERKARAIELHYFAGMSYEELAEVLGVSPATVHRDLRLARAWLYHELS